MIWNEEKSLGKNIESEKPGADPESQEAILSEWTDTGGYSESGSETRPMHRPDWETVMNFFFFEKIHSNEQICFKKLTRPPVISCVYFQASIFGQCDFRKFYLFGDISVIFL